MEVEFIKQYNEIENRILPLLELIHDKFQDDTMYKGFQILNSPVIRNCEILFIGINPGGGGYKEAKNKQTEKKPRRYGSSATSIDWFKDGNARGHWDNEIWVKTKWHERNVRKVNNSFVRNMIDVLYEIARLKTPNNYENYTQEPQWYKEWGNKIILGNVCPISTTTSKELKKLLKKIASRSEVKDLLNDEIISSWSVKKIFLKYIEELIELTKPTIIVCMGKEAYDNFCKYFKTKRIQENLIYASIGNVSNYEFPVIGFSRRWGWHKNIIRIAQAINKYSINTNKS